MNRWRSHTTEKLYLASVQLQLWQECSNDDVNVFKPLEESHKQSAILLLYAAWEGLINELADYHQQNAHLLLTIEALVDKVGNDIPEVEFLIELSRVEGSWLADLRKANMLIRLPQNRESAGSEASLADNALIATSGSALPVDAVENLKRILDEFKDYLEGLRSRMSEW